MIKMNVDRVLVVVVFMTAILIFTAMMLFVPEKRQMASIEFDRHPLLGNKEAPVHMVIFEDFQCPGCRVFNERIFPHLKSQYIDSGKMKLTFIPLPLFEGSDLASNAALSVYDNQPESFFLYLDRIIHSIKTEEISKELLLGHAKDIEGLDLALFEEKMDQGRLSDNLRKNISDATAVMGEIETPALFINGKMVKNISLSELFYQIEERLEKTKHDQ